MDKDKLKVDAIKDIEQLIREQAGFTCFERTVIKLLLAILVK